MEMDIFRPIPIIIILLKTQNIFMPVYILDLHLLVKIM